MVEIREYEGRGWEMFGQDTPRVINHMQEDPTIFDAFTFRELWILASRFDLTDGPPYRLKPPTYRQIGDQLGINYQTVIRDEGIALRKLLKGLAIHFLDDPVKPGWFRETNVLRLSQRSDNKLRRDGVEFLHQVPEYLDRLRNYAGTYGGSKTLDEVERGFNFVQTFRGRQRTG